MHSIKCPKLVHNSTKINSKIVDKNYRKVHVLKVCCGNYKNCSLCKEWIENEHNRSSVEAWIWCYRK